MTSIQKTSDPLTVQSRSHLSVHWRLVTASDPVLGRRYQDVMAEMDHHYAEGNWPDVFRLMTADGCQYYVGCGQAFELVIGFQWDGDRQKYQVRSVGFRGDIEPHEALILIADQVAGFAHEHRQSHVYAIIPLTMDNARIVQLHGLIPWFPGWKITGGHHVAGGTYWRLEPPNDITQES